MNRKDLPTKSGIYYIFCKANGRGYIGSSKNIKYRICGHFSSLRKGNHHNPHMQNTYNKYDENSFEFKILCLCPEEYRLKLEQWFLDKSTLNIDINIRKTIDGPYVQQDEDNNNSIKLKRAQVIEIIKLINEQQLSYSEIAKLFNITTTNVRCIQTGKTWNRLNYLVNSDIRYNRHFKMSRSNDILIINNLIETGNIAETSRKFGITEKTVRNILENKKRDHLIDLKNKALQSISIRAPYSRYKLSYNEYSSIRNLITKGFKNKDVVEETGFCATTISDIRYNKKYHLYNEQYLKNNIYEL